MQTLILNELNRRLFDESYPRINSCLHLLTEDQIWHRPNSSCNSIGNLVLHLMGNVRQWILSGLIGQKDIRKRKVEFEIDSRLPRSELTKVMNSLKSDVLEALPHLPPNWVEQIYHIQGFEENGIGVVVHVIEHFSYHTGQISLYTKILLDQDLRYYENIDLDK